MRKILIIIFLIRCCNLPAQQECIDCNPDSLANRLNDNISDADRLLTLVAITNMNILPRYPDSVLHSVQIIFRLNQKLRLIDEKPYRLVRDAMLLWKRNEGDSALQRLRDAISVFDEQKKIQGNYSLLNTIREFYNMLSLHKERLAFYEEKLNFYQHYGPMENMAACFHGIAGYYYFKADYNQAIGYYLKAAEVFHKFSKIGYSNEITVVGFMYSKWGNDEKALHYLKLADSLNTAVFTGREGNLELDKIELAKIYRNKGRFDLAFSYAWGALAISRKFYHADRTAIEFTELAGIYLRMNQPDTALFFLRKAALLGDSVMLTVDGPEGPFECDYYLYKYFSQKNELKIAENQLLKAYVKAFRVKSNQLLMKYEKELAGFYLKQNDQLKAMEFLQKYVELNDSLNSIQASTSVAQFENEQMEQHNLDQIASMKATEHSQQRYFLLAGAFLLVIMAGLFSRIQYIRKTKKKLEWQNRMIEREKLRAEQSEKFKEQFLANMSHEIRTPMNAVMGMNNLLIDKNPRRDQQQYLDGIKQSSDTLLHIINDILDLSKIEAGKIELEKIDFSIRGVLNQVVLTLSHKAEEKGLQLITGIDDQIPDVLVGDPVRLNQILMNLTGNAIKFTEKGSVQISVNAVESDQLSILNFKFSIIDTGIGIPKDKLYSIFESFAQVHTSDTRRFGGTGLGLSISKQLVELMGGTLQVESIVDSGTTFSFVLQMEKGSSERLQQRISTEEEIDGTILNGLKILVVDDNEYNRIVATDTIKARADVEVLTASNGREAIELVDQNHFDIVLMDVQMPVMNGFDATRYIRENFSPPKKNIPVVALTASVLRTDLDKCRVAGMNGYIPKPFNASQLVKGIAEVMGIEIRIVRKIVEDKSKPVSEGAGYKATDLAYLEKFCEGDKERMKKYIRMYTEAVPTFLELLNSNGLLHQPDELAIQVHTMKPKFMMMGMKDAQQTAIEIEKLCHEENQSNTLPGKINELKVICENSLIELTG